MAYDLTRQRKYSEAITFLSQERERVDDPDFLLPPLVNAMREAGHRQEALKMAKEGVNRLPQFTPLKRSMLLCLVAARRNVEAKRIAEELLDEDPDDADNLWAAGHGLLTAREYKRAAALGDRLISLTPRRSRGWRLRGAARYYMGDRRGAVEDYRKALELDPADFGVARALGRILVRSGRFREAFRIGMAALEARENGVRSN